MELIKMLVTPLHRFDDHRSCHARSILRTKISPRCPWTVVKTLILRFRRLYDTDRERLQWMYRSNYGAVKGAIIFGVYFQA
jgi:hypothetical protein